MADPEQLYQEVLAEEQGKGVTPAVAEGRAKAARKRAEEGSPHPKEPKWWPGAQPHFEGNGQAEAVEEEPAAEEAPAEEPAAEAPAEEVTVDRQAEELEQEQTPAAPAAAEQPTAPAQPAAPAPTETQPAAAPVAAPAQQPAAAATTQPQGTLGVTHGTTTGTRLRPEDEVSTEAQFEGQKAMYERRKLIDELVATGVPAVTASETDRPRTPWLAVLYLLIPLLVIFYLAGQENDTAAEEGGETQTEAPAEGSGEGGGGGGTTLVAEGTAWQQDTLTVTAGEPASIEVENLDATVHNMSIYPDEDAALAKQNPLFTGPDVNGGETVTNEVDPLDKGTYTFICDYHTNMIGELVAE